MTRFAAVLTADEHCQKRWNWKVENHFTRKMVMDKQEIVPRVSCKKGMLSAGQVTLQGKGPGWPVQGHSEGDV